MNGKAALEMIRQYRPDIVITDIKMPVMNGLELVKICRDEFGPSLYSSSLQALKNFL